MDDHRIITAHQVIALTDAEMKLVRKLRRREKFWKSTRWAALLVGVVVTITSSIFFRELWQELRQEGLLLVLVAVVAPTCALFFFGGVALVCYTLVSWKGRAAVKLLLRLTARHDLDGH